MPDTAPDLVCAVAVIQAGMVEADQKTADREMARMAVAHFFFGRLSALDPTKNWPEIAIDEARKMPVDRETLLRKEMACMGRKASLMLGMAVTD
ncbi:MAG TPA: hypothetical protein VF463_18950 [Sphingobium sp.]